MPRRSRQQAEGAVHHAWGHAIRNEPLFVDPVDRQVYLELLQQTVLERHLRLLAYCQMTTHVHLLIETPRANLDAAMQWLHGRYAVLFNQRHGLRGHLFEKRYGSKRQVTDVQLQTAAAYVVNNPVAANLVDRPEDWRWSSHFDVVNDLAPRWLDARRLLEFFGASGGDPLDRYRRFVADARRMPPAA